jgi:hypothetical protein
MSQQERETEECNRLRSCLTYRTDAHVTDRRSHFSRHAMAFPARPVPRSSAGRLARTSTHTVSHRLHCPHQPATHVVRAAASAVAADSEVRRICCSQEHAHESEGISRTFWVPGPAAIHTFIH